MSSDLTFNFDVFLACVLPLALFIMALRTNAARSWTWAGLRGFFSLQSFKGSAHGPFSLQKAHQSYSQYRYFACEESVTRRASYNSLGRAHKRLGNKIGYAKKLDNLTYVTDMNSVITQKITKLAAEAFNIRVSEVYSSNGDLWRVREALKHFVRDWSTEGSLERERILGPILAVLREVNPGERRDKRVLVPGSGLGRLAWEISQLGVLQPIFSCIRTNTVTRIRYDCK